MNKDKKFRKLTCANCLKTTYFEQDTEMIAMYCCPACIEPMEYADLVYIKEDVQWKN